LIQLPLLPPRSPLISRGEGVEIIRFMRKIKMEGDMAQVRAIASVGPHLTPALSPPDGSGEGDVSSGCLSFKTFT